MNKAGTKAQLKIENMPLSESITFGGPAGISASADLVVTWTASGPAVERGSGADAESPESPDAFRGLLAPANCTGRAKGWRTGFSFDTGQLTSDGYYATLGTEQNGAFL